MWFSLGELNYLASLEDFHVSPGGAYGYYNVGMIDTLPQRCGDIEDLVIHPCKIFEGCVGTVREAECRTLRI